MFFVHLFLLCRYLTYTYLIYLRNVKLMTTWTWFWTRYRTLYVKYKNNIYKWTHGFFWLDRFPSRIFDVNNECSSRREIVNNDDLKATMKADLFHITSGLIAVFFGSDQNSRYWFTYLRQRKKIKNHGKMVRKTCSHIDPQGKRAKPCPKRQLSQKKFIVRYVVDWYYSFLKPGSINSAVV